MIPVNLMEQGFYQLVPVTINDSYDTWFILDTGASRTVVNQQLAEELGFDILSEEEVGLRLGNSITIEEDEADIDPEILQENIAMGAHESPLDMHFGQIAGFQIGNLLLKDYLVGLLNIKHIVEFFERLRNTRIDGFIGGDLLKDYQAVIDYGQQTIILNNDSA